MTSSATTEYNCIAWAAGIDDAWWWPDGLNYWPAGAPIEETISAFVQAYATVGFQICDDDRLEKGYEKVALYAVNGKPKHAARQVPSGWWTSKLGPNVDIEHYAPGAIEGSEYGFVVQYLKRRRP